MNNPIYIQNALKIIFWFSRCICFSSKWGAFATHCAIVCFNMIGVCFTIWNVIWSFRVKWACCLVWKQRKKISRNYRLETSHEIKRTYLYVKGNKNKPAAPPLFRPKVKKPSCLKGIPTQSVYPWFSALLFISFDLSPIWRTGKFFSCSWDR